MQRLSTWRVGHSRAQQWHLCSRRYVYYTRQLSSTARSLSDDPPANKKATPEVEINYYEQTTPSRSSIRRISHDEFEETDVTDSIKARIQHLQAQLHILESGKSPEELTPEERKVIAKAEAEDPLMRKQLRDVAEVQANLTIPGEQQDKLDFEDTELTPEERKAFEETEGGKEAFEQFLELRKFAEDDPNTFEEVEGGEEADEVEGAEEAEDVEDVEYSGKLSEEQMVKLLNGEDSEEIERLLAQLSQEERGIIEKARSGEELSKREIMRLLSGGETLEGEDVFDEETGEMDLEDLEFELPSEHRRNLQKLTELLRNFSENPLSRRGKLLLWQQYTLCKDQLPGFEEQLPKEAWAILWQSQYYMEGEDEARSRHLWTLAEDMDRCRKTLSAQQRMVLIERRIAEAKLEEALHMWEQSRKELENDENVSESFRDLGPSILSSLARPNDAHSLALELAAASPRVSTFIPVIEAWLRQKSKSGSGKAWAIYLKIRELMKDRITPEDYDLLVMTFFKGGQLQSSLVIFKDLVVAGRESGLDSLELRHKSSDVLKHLQEQAQDADAVNNVSLSSLTVLPYRFQNKFFYAMWMKRLIGMGEIDAAGSVLELMYLRGVQADPRHINGLISALLRRGRPGNKSTGRLGDKELALETAWAMVQQRLDFIVRRRLVNSGEPPPPVPDDPAQHLPPYLVKNLPPATNETFAILLLYYTRSNMQASVEKVNTFLDYAELQPNIFYLNHLLYFQLRRGDRSSLWALYLRATQSRISLPPALTLASSTPALPNTPLTPDLSTFSCLWDASKAHVAANPSIRRQLVDRTGIHFPGPRTLFGHFTRWLSSLSEKQRDEAKADFTHDLYTQIIRSFCLTRDLPGTLIVLYALRDHFGHFPTADDVRLVSIQLARSSEPHLGGWKTRRVGRFGDKKGSQVQLGRVTELLEVFRKERGEALQKMGVKKEDLGPKEQGEETLWILGGLLRAVMEGKRADGQRVGAEEGGKEGSVGLEDDVEKVAWKMGAGGLRLGAPVYKKSWVGGPKMVGYEGLPLKEAPEGEDRDVD